MKSALLVFAFACAAAIAQTHTSAPSTLDSLYSAGSLQSHAMQTAAPASSFRPFSRFSFGGGVSPLGINMHVATNLNRRMNARITGNLLHLNINDISSNGFEGDAHLVLSSAGASLDVFPFPRHGLRFSPGVLFYNTNAVNGTFTASPGTSFTLNDVTYYSSTANPVAGFGGINLHKQSPAFTLTSGWGNMIPRNDGHFSFPFEIGVAFIGSPDVALKLTSGQACDANGANCVNVATDPSVQANLATQINKYRGNLDPLKTYPILSFGVAYSFSPRVAQTN